jgi:hypothetical protein
MELNNHLDPCDVIKPSLVGEFLCGRQKLNRAGQYSDDDHDG